MDETVETVVVELFSEQEFELWVGRVVLDISELKKLLFLTTAVFNKGVGNLLFGGVGKVDPVPDTVVVIQIDDGVLVHVLDVLFLVVGREIVDGVDFVAADEESESAVAEVLHIGFAFSNSGYRVAVLLVFL